MPTKQKAHAGLLWATIRQLAARPQGCSTAEVIDTMPSADGKVGQACNELRRRGEVVVWRISHRRARYYATQALMHAHQAAIEQSTRTKYTVKQKPRGLVLAADAPVTVPEGLVVQVGPRYEPRNTSFEFSFWNQRKSV